MDISYETRKKVTRMEKEASRKRGMKEHEGEMWRIKESTDVGWGGSRAQHWTFLALDILNYPTNYTVQATWSPGENEVRIVGVLVFGVILRKRLRSVPCLLFPLFSIKNEGGSHEGLRPYEWVLTDRGLRTKPRLWKVLEITKAWKFPTFSGKVNAFMIQWDKH